MTEPLEKGMFQCTRCKGIFPSGKTEEAALAECQRIFGKPPPSPAERSVLCDDCFHKFMEWYVDT
jgi:hypothetical protein